MVAKGWNQVPGQDCGSTFAPVCRLQSVRMVLAIAAEMDWEVRQLNVKTAFLYADIEEEVFVAEAPGFETNNNEKGLLVMKHGKSLYGLAQSPGIIFIPLIPLLSQSDLFLLNLIHTSTSTTTTGSSSSSRSMWTIFL